MPKRHSQPWYRPSRDTFYVTIRGKQHNLATNDEEEAWRRFHALMTKLDDGPGALTNPTTVAELLALFAEWSERHCERSTYDWYRHYLDSFLKSIKPSMPAEKLKPHHVTRWLDSNPQWGVSGQRAAIGTLKRAINWSVGEGYLEVSPITKVRKPRAARRESILTESQRKLIVDEASDQQFRDLVELSVETGVRPQEVRSVEARHFDPENAVWVFPSDEHKTGDRTGQPRVVYLTPKAVEITTRLAKANPDGPLCRNSVGAPWTSNAVRCRLRRLRLRLAGKLPADLCAYLFRHTYATEALEHGVDPVTLAELMGHKDATMVSKVYQHVRLKGGHMRKAARKARGQSAS